MGSDSERERHKPKSEGQVGEVGKLEESSILEVRVLDNFNEIKYRRKLDKKRGGTKTEKRPLDLEQKYFTDYLRKCLNMMVIAVELKKSTREGVKRIVGRRHTFC